MSKIVETIHHGNYRNVRVMHIHPVNVDSLAKWLEECPYSIAPGGAVEGIAGRLCSITAFGGWLAMCAAHGSETLANQHVNPPIPACVGEDTPGPCFWDATHRGNGLGRSFVIDAEGSVSYR